MFRSRWANLVVILIVILVLVPAAFFYGAYMGTTNMAKHFADVQMLGFQYGSMETIADTPLLGSLLAKGLCDNLKKLDDQAAGLPQVKDVPVDFKMTQPTDLVRKACAQ